MKLFVQTEHQADDGVQPILPCSTWGEFFCAHTQMLIEMFLEEKAKLNDVKLLGLSWAHTMWYVCTLKCTWKNRYMPRAGLIQYVLLWFVTAEDSWNMNRKKCTQYFYFTYISNKHKALRLYLPSPQRVPWCIFYPSFSSW